MTQQEKNIGRFALINRYNLSPRQLEVAQLAYTGITNKEIADKLFVCVSAIKFHMTYILKKCKVKNRKDLIALIDQLGQKQ